MDLQIDWVMIYLNWLTVNDRRTDIDVISVIKVVLIQRKRKQAKELKHFALKIHRTWSLAQSVCLLYNLTSCLQVFWIWPWTFFFFLFFFDWTNALNKRKAQSIKVECFPLKALSYRSKKQINRRRWGGQPSWKKRTNDDEREKKVIGERRNK